MSSQPPEAPPPDEQLPPDEEAEIVRRAEEAPENARNGNVIPWEALFPPKQLAG